MTSIQSAVLTLPDHVYPQARLVDQTLALWSRQAPLPKLAVAKFQRIVRGLGIETRHLAWPIDTYPEIGSFSDANARFEAAAKPLAERALREALRRSSAPAQQIDTIYVASITGLMTPSLDAHLVERVGLRRDVARLPSYGLGCVAGVSLLARAHDRLRRAPGERVAVATVELCSLTLQHRDTTPENMVAAGLFADGAAASILSGDEGRVQIVDTESCLLPDTASLMRWDMTSDGFKLTLSREIPGVIARALPDLVGRLLSRHGLDRSAVGHWLIHPGGPRVLNAIETALELPSEALEPSRALLRRAGNMSSATIFGLIEPYVAHGTGWAVVVGMGPGLSVEALLLHAAPFA